MGRPRRATYVLLTRADSPDATERLNRIKGRPPDQVLAVSGTADMLHLVSCLRRDDSGPPNLGETIRKMFAAGPIGVLLPARSGLPAPVVSGGPRNPKVMVAGECPPSEYNFHSDVIDRLARLNVLVAASSCNRTGDLPYTAHDFADGRRDLGPALDAFIEPLEPVPAMRLWDALVSCTAFDMTTAPPGFGDMR